MQLWLGQGFPRESRHRNLGMCLSRRVNSALAMHRDIHPRPSHGQMKGQTMKRAISSQQPQQWEYRPLPQTPLTSLLLYPQYFREKTKSGPPSSWQAVFGARRQQECHSRREKREHSTADRPQDAAPHLPSKESKLFCLWDTSSFSRPCLGSGLFRGAAFSCIGVALQGDTRQPPRKGEEGSGAVNLFPSIPARTETSESAAQGQREYFCYFSSHVERKKKKAIFLPGTPQRSQQSSQIAAAPWDNTLQSRASPP